MGYLRVPTSRGTTRSLTRQIASAASLALLSLTGNAAWSQTVTLPAGGNGMITFSPGISPMSSSTGAGWAMYSLTTTPAQAAQLDYTPFGPIGASCLTPASGLTDMYYESTVPTYTGSAGFGGVQQVKWDIQTTAFTPVANYSIDQGVTNMGISTSGTPNGWGLLPLYCKDMSLFAGRGMLEQLAVFVPKTALPGTYLVHFQLLAKNLKVH